MERHKIDELIQAYLEGRATPEERRWLELHYLDYLDQEPVRPSRAQLDGSLARTYSRIVQAIELEPAPLKQRKWIRLLPYAAAILVVGGLLVLLRPMPVPPPMDLQSLRNESIAPGGNKAILSMEGAEALVLDERQEGIIMDENLIVYQDGSPLINASSPTKNYTLETPKGGTYQLQLADGSKVWLNAASRISYGADLGSAPRREVRLEGEAYFEVAPDEARPFVVKTAKEVIEVLGTHFNIHAYAEETTSRTTLLEGSVRINDDTILRPGQQAIVSADGALRTQEVDAQKVIAWKNGKFVFESEDLESVLQKIGRWYNVEISYEHTVSGKTFSGTVSRFEDLEQLLHIISYTSNVQFKAEGRRIVVMP